MINCLQDQLRNQKIVCFRKGLYKTIKSLKNSKKILKNQIIPQEISKKSKSFSAKASFIARY